MDLTDADVTDILALLDSLPYDELDLETPRFRLTLRRTPHGWTQATQVLSAPTPLTPVPLAPALSASASLETTTMEHRGRHSDINAPSLPGTAGAGRDSAEVSGAGEAEEAGGELVAVLAPLPGTFYRAPRPGAAPFVEVGSRVSADTVIGIVETMKLMNSVHAGVDGTVAEFCVQNTEFAAHGATLLRIRADT
jgi:acetyl-CoA carboxylase biotin carboxyl carrier protein